MKFRSTLLMTLLSLSLLIVPSVLADHEWEVTGVTCDGGSNTIRIFGHSTINTSNDTFVYANGVYIGTFYGGDFTDGPVSFTVSDSSFVEGAEIFVENPTTGTSASTICGQGSGNGTEWFEPGDDRINRQAYAPIAVYCTDASLKVYAINGDGDGVSVMDVAYSTLPSVPTAESGNTLIETAGSVQLYRLTSGEFLARVGPDAEGKFYRLVWDACPQTYVQASIEQNGVITVAEVTPNE